MPMKFIVRPTYTRVIDATPDERSEVRYALRAETPRDEIYGSKYVEYFERYYKSGDEETTRYRFLSGLVDKVVAALQEVNVAVDVEYRIPFPDMSGPYLAEFKYTLSDRQREAVEAIAMHGRGIIAGAVNSGKTDIAIEVIHRLLNNGKPQLVVVPNTELIYSEWVPRLIASGVPESRVGIVHRNRLELNDVVVTTYQTFSKRLNLDVIRAWLRTVGAVYGDECHMAGKDGGYAKVFMKAVNAPVRVFLSGTALDYGDDRNFRVVGLSGPVIATLPDQELVDAGRSASPAVSVLNVWQRQDRPRVTRFSGYETTRHLCFLENPEIPEAIAEYVWEYWFYQTAVFVNHVEHGNYIWQMLPPWVKRQAAWISGKTPQRVKTMVLNDFERGDLRLLITSPILDQGINKLRGANTVIHAGDGKSPVKLMQRSGRGLRQKEENWLNIILLWHPNVRVLERQLRKKLVRLDKAFPNIPQGRWSPSDPKRLLE